MSFLKNTCIFLDVAIYLILMNELTLRFIFVFFEAEWRNKKCTDAISYYENKCGKDVAGCYVDPNRNDIPYEGNSDLAY